MVQKERHLAGLPRRVGRGAPGRARVPREQREREMITSAAKIFGRNGYGATSMDEIAADCGITKPMLYAYFGSKGELFEACGRAAAEHLLGAVRAAGARKSEPPALRLWYGLVAIFSFIGEHRNLWSIFNAAAGQAPEEASDVARKGKTAMTELMETLLTSTAMEQGVGEDAAGQAAPLAHALTSAVLGMAEWWIDHPDETAELQALRIMNLVWTGFEGLLQGRMWLPVDTAQSS